MADQKQPVLTPEQQAELKYMTIMQRVADKLAKAQIGDKAGTEQGVAIIGSLVKELAMKDIPDKFSGVLSLADCMAILGAVAACQVVVSAKMGSRITAAMIPEMADLFYTAIIVELRNNKIALAGDPKIVKA